MSVGSVSCSGISEKKTEKHGNSDSQDTGLHNSLHKNQETPLSPTVQALANLLANLSEADRVALSALLNESNRKRD